MKTRKISQADFNDVDPVRKLIVHDHARRFAFMDLDQPLGTFALSWRSDTIEPVIEQSGFALWVGVDQHIAAIDLKNGHVALSLPLNSNLLQVRTIEGGLVAALTETEVILFNSNFSIRLMNGLPDLPNLISVERQLVTIQLVDGTTMKLNAGTGLAV